MLTKPVAGALDVNDNSMVRQPVQKHGCHSTPGPRCFGSNWQSYQDFLFIAHFEVHWTSTNNALRNPEA